MNLLMSESKTLRSLRTLSTVAVTVATIVLIVYFLNNCRDIDSYPPAIHTVITTKPGSYQVGKIPDLVHKKMDFVYPGDVRRDPFIREINDVANVTEHINKLSEPLPILTGVIWSREDPIAILADRDHNTHLLRVNEMVGSYEVVGVFPISVVLRKDRQRYELKLWREEDQRLRASSNLQQ